MLGEGDTVKCFFQSISDIQFQGFFLEHEIFSCNASALVSKFHCVCFSSITKIVFTGNERSACNNIFSELLLSEKLRHYHEMNTTSTIDYPLIFTH